MDLDPTQRFSSRVNDYVRFRPSYPKGITDLLARQCGLAENSQIADIGSGTGLLARIFLDYGCEVFGVEPNPDMRLAGERALGAWPPFHSVNGRAEATTLPDRSVDFVTAAQAFHWFAPEQARGEFRRILKPNGWVVLVWNDRLNHPGLMVDYESLVRRYGPERPRVKLDEIERFFDGTAWFQATLPNQQQLDLDGLRGRFLSSSYAPLPGAANHEPLMEGIASLFEKYKSDGIVTLLYETLIYFGSFKP